MQGIVGGHGTDDGGRVNKLQVVPAVMMAGAAAVDDQGPKCCKLHHSSLLSILVLLLIFIQLAVKIINLQNYYYPSSRLLIPS